MNPDFPELRPQIRLKEPLRPQIGLKEPLRLVRASAELATESHGDRAAHGLEALPPSVSWQALSTHQRCGKGPRAQ